MKLHLLISLCFLFAFFELDAQSFKWANCIVGSSSVQPTCSTLDGSGNIYTVGIFEGTVDFDPDENTALNRTSNGDFDVFIQKMNSSGDLIWIKSFGGLFLDAPESVKVDYWGNVYITGTFSDVVDFDPGSGNVNQISQGYRDCFVQKLDSIGNFVWVKSFGGISYDTGKSLSLDEMGNVYVAGNFGDTVDFDPGPGIDNHISQGPSHFFIQKLDSMGSFVWAQTFGGPSYDEAVTMSLDNNGNIYSAGAFEYDFYDNEGNTLLISNGDRDAFIQKMNSSGDLIWAKSFGGTYTDAIEKIVADSIGNIYCLGGFEDTVDFDPNFGVYNLICEDYADLFLVKMSEQGGLIWVKTFSSSYIVNGCSISIESDENIYLLGGFTGTVDFDPSFGTKIVSSIGVQDVYIEKLDSDGNFLWVKTFNGSSNLIPNSISADNFGNVYVTGMFDGISDFNPGPAVNLLYPLGSNCFVQKLGPCGPTIVESAFASPTSANNCQGTYAVTILGDGYFELDIDNGSQNTTSNGFSLLTDLCSGFHDLQIINYCGDTLSTTIVIPVDSNYVFNNPFIDSLAQDSLGVTLTNCDIYYAGIDTAYIDSIWANGNTVNVIWNIVDSNGSNFDTTVYVLNNGNGVYWLQLSVFCPNKSVGLYFTVTEAIYFNNGSVSTAGLTDIGKDLFAIYPNPTNDQVHINFSGSDAELTVYDVQGKVVLKDKIQNQEIISLQSFGRGVYLFDFNNSQGRSVQRVVKQ